MTSAKESELNLVQIFLDRVRRYGYRNALLYRPAPNQPYASITWHQWVQRVRCTALGLAAMGVTRADRVGLLSENRPEWTYADLGTLSLGAADVPIYPSSTAKEVGYILQHAGVKILFVSNQIQLDKLLSEKGLLPPSVQAIVTFDEVQSAEPRVLPFSRLLEKGRLFELNNPGQYQAAVDSVAPQDLATVIYTSGTTGPPKGVMLTHANFIANYLGAREYIKASDEDIALSFLPLCHVFERLAGYYFMTFHGAVIAYATSMQTVAEDIQVVRPTISAAVPRFYEKVHARILERVAQASPAAQRLFRSCVNAGLERSRCCLQGKRPSLKLSLRYALARRIVFNKLRKSLGGRLRFFISGGAPLGQELAEFFYSAGVLILEGYGLTETSPVIAVNREDDFKFGTVGKPLPNVEVKLAEDGEILTQGPCVMKGYFENEQATAEVMKGGWFHTGDIGVFTDDGHLKITDRKKDIIVTSGGKNVSPQNIENLILTDPLFAQAVVIGDKRNYLIALLVPNREQLMREGQALGLNLSDWDRLLKEPRVFSVCETRLRDKMKDLAPYEQIKYFAFLNRELTQEAGELTPTLKVKRRFVMEKYRDLIDSVYAKGSQWDKS